jgi:hypothetical protein
MRVSFSPDPWATEVSPDPCEWDHIICDTGGNNIIALYVLTTIRSKNGF